MFVPAAPCEGDWWYCHGQDFNTGLGLAAIGACALLPKGLCLLLAAGVLLADTVDGVIYRDWSTSDIACNAATSVATEGAGALLGRGARGIEGGPEAAGASVSLGATTIDIGDPCLGFA